MSRTAITSVPLSRAAEGPGWRPRLSWPEPAGLLIYAGVVAAITLLGAVGVLPRWPGLIHLVALPPLDLFADLRWLMSHATGHPWFGIGVVASAGLRIGLIAVLAGGARQPRWRLAIGVYLAAVVPALLAALVGFISHAALYSRLFGASLIIAGIVFVLLGGAPWQDRDRLGPAFRTNLRSGLRLVDLAAYTVAVLLLGVLASATGPVGAVGLVPVSGALTLVAIARLRAPAPRASLRWSAIVAVVVAAIAAVVVTTRGEPWRAADEQRPGSILIMSGINSASGEGAIFELRPERLGYTCDQTYYYSYAGTGDGQPRGVATCPIRTGAPYEPDDTQRPFAEQVELLVAQTQDLEPPVIVFGHSQAAWVAWAAAASGELDGVEHLVLIGAFPSNPLGYPPPGEPGQGRVGGDLFRLIEPLPQLLDFDFVVDAPLSRELLATPDAASDVFDRSLPEDAGAIALTSVTDLPLMPDGWTIEGAVDACPLREAHPYLPITPAFYRMVDGYLTGAPDDGCPPLAELYRLTTLPFGLPGHGG